MDTSTLVGDLVTERPSRSRVLERYGLDYCCGGRRTLSDACLASGVDVERVLADLEAADLGDAGDRGWVALGPSALCDHLEATHHAYLRAELPRLAALADKVAAAHGGRHPEVLEVRDVLAELTADLMPHLAKEEQVLFPAIRRLDEAGALDGPSAMLGGPIGCMGIEHEMAGALLAQLQALTEGYTAPADGCGTFRAFYDGLRELDDDLKRHIHKENNVLFPRVLEGSAATSEA